MPLVYRFRIIRNALLTLIGTPAFICLGIALILLLPQVLFIWIIGIINIITFSAFFYTGIRSLRRQMQDDRALILTPQEITIRQLDGQVHTIKWNEIAGFSEFSIRDERFISVNLYEPEKYAPKESGKWRNRLTKVNKSLTGSTINIPTNTIHCKHRELQATLHTHLEKYGRNARWINPN